MQPFPHHYQASAAANVTGDVVLQSGGLPAIRSASPEEFEGPGGRWSPETLLTGAVADCFVLTFRALAKYSNLPWSSLTCEVEGTLDRLDRVTQFTAFHVRAVLRVPEGTPEQQALRLLERAEHTCLITASLKAPCHLDAEIEFVAPVPALAAMDV